MNAHYEPGQQKLWTGRQTSAGIEPQYWYQHIRCANLMNLKDSKTPSFGLIGYACDAGVKRNFGRTGAKGGPDEVRKKLGKLPLHFDKDVVDFGNVNCLDADLESCQKAFSLVIANVIDKDVFPIGMGGGHDIAYAHYMGLRQALPKKRIGIINFDAHFDLRPVESQPNSGTPFNEILKEFENKGEAVDYFAIGIQKQSNTKQIFEIANRFNVNFVFNDVCDNSEENLFQLQTALKPIIRNNDYLYITIDLDGFSSAYASGVSAPSPFGFSPVFVYKVLEFLLKSGKMVSCDIAELNPKYDKDALTASLAAKLIDFIISNA
ncbi:formimidoylglutamase [Hyunsoonleella flava]|uniref:Formimidoylglutamase n=1 Tax=Hyunsoonleella flava TaxID=2527939 RepID=A0A4Q9FID5_9FLAO|nr:formimidoylglutamase [Hyunsoonleella flava]